MKTWRLSRPLFVVGILVAAYPGSADVLFSTVPADGNLFGAPGSLVGWGYSLANTDSLNWFMATNLNSDSFSNGSPTLLFDFPILAPGASLTEAFDPVNSIGLFELQWDVSVPIGFVNSGNFVLSGQWWNGDPLNGGNFIADAPDISLPYTATVTSTTTSPEPSSLWLLGLPLATILVFKAGLRRRRAFETPARPLTSA